MAVKTKDKKDQHSHDLIENPEALAEQLTNTEEFIIQHKNIVMSVVAVLVIIVSGFFLYDYYQKNQNEKAQTEMFQAVYYFEADSLDLALNGDGNNRGFLGIIEEYGDLKATRLANFYAGTAYLKQGKYKLAILYLEDFSSDDLLVQPRAYSLIGDAYMELGEYDNAVNYYEKASNYKPTKEFTPTYMMKAALAHEKAGDAKEAKAYYQQVIDEYGDSGEAVSAKKYLALLK